MIERNEWKPLMLLISLYIALKLLTYLYGLVFFDEGVYTGIARYFITFGNAGYFEPLRPLLLPLLLTPFQFLPVNALVTGRFVSLFLAILSIVAVYYSSMIHFGKKAALWSSTLFIGSYSIMFFSGYILVDVPAAALTALSASLVLKGRYIECGTFAGLAFLFKFPAIIILPILVLYTIVYEKKDSIKPVFKLLISSALLMAPFCIYNIIRYDGSLFERLTTPMMQARAIIESPTWIYQTSSILEYAKYTMTAEIVITAFAILSIYYIQKKHRRHFILYIACIISFLFYFGLKVPRYDIRYVITFLPFLIFMAGYGMMNLESVISRKAKMNVKYILVAVAIIPAVLVSVAAMLNAPIQSDPEIGNIIADYSGGHIVTNSAFPMLYAKGKITLFAGPSLSNTFIEYQKDNNSEWFIIDPDGYPCPTADINCIKGFQKRMSRILTQNGVITCGKLNGARVAIISKNDSFIEPDECGRKIGYDDIRNVSVSFFVRLSGVVFTQEGDFANSDNLGKTIILLAERNIETVISFVPVSNIPDKKSIDFIKSLPSNIKFGVMEKPNSDVEEFISMFERETTKDIEYIIPSGDDWTGLHTSIPRNIKQCIVGSWDMSSLPIPCKAIDIYMIKSWENKEFFDSGHIIEEVNMIVKSDYEIGIDVPAEILTEGNYQIVKEVTGKFLE